MQDVRVGLGVKLAYGFGAVANQVKSRGIQMFLMLFYNQVVGLSPTVVSAIIMISLIFDGIFDPLIGQASDNFRSRWGRRHPFMYAAAIPVALLYFLLWNPPAWSDAGIAAYLLVVLVGVRFFDTFYELPTAALAPELASNYDERTQLGALRAFFGVVGSLGMTTLALKVFLKEDADGGGGVLSRAGYFNYSVAAAIVIFCVILICCVGTHSQIPRLSQAPARQAGGRGFVRQITETLGNRSFIVLAIAGFLAAAGIGLSASLEMYWNLYFYRITQSQIVVLTTAGVAASVVGALISTRLSILMGKRNAAIALFLLMPVCAAIPILLRATHIVEDPQQLFAVLLPLHAIGSGATVCGFVMITAMMMDVVEQVQLKTGRRSEGLLFSADQLVKKLTSGVGVLGSGLILAAVSFPTEAGRAQVPEAVLTQMAAYYLPALATCMGLCAISLCFYTITRQDHAAMQAQLREGAAPRPLDG